MVGANNCKQKMLPANLEIKSGDTLYKVTSVYADKGDFRALWEELIIKASHSNGVCKAS
jgi:hypothetical protein